MCAEHDETGASPLPPDYGKALEEVRAAIARCEANHVPAGSIVAALMTEMMPRLVSAYGVAGAASALGDLAGFIAKDEEPTSIPH